MAAANTNTTTTTQTRTTIVGINSIATFQERFEPISYAECFHLTKKSYSLLNAKPLIGKVYFCYKVLIVGMTNSKSFTFVVLLWQLALW